MPLIQDISVGKNRLGLWKIDGSEIRFESEFPNEAAQLSVRHPRTQLQRYASRLLLAEMLGQMPEVLKDEHGKPLLPNHPFDVSISHTEGFAAILLGTGKLGVDVQHYKPNVLKVRDRFLDENEQLLAQDIETTTLFWAAKEAIYKYNALPGLDFRQPITIHSIQPEILPSSFVYNELQTNLSLGWKKLDDAMLVWTI
ncbi:MAG: 4'-phosphopantetheinyl transferase superfamily protein [Flavobacteriales bacterium]|nr:4'-phosphopantetheinyl transferase superfamily protein [Flavobacteriales bacterium]